MFWKSTEVDEDAENGGKKKETDKETKKNEMEDDTEVIYKKFWSSRGHLYNNNKQL